MSVKRDLVWRQKRPTTNLCRPCRPTSAMLARNEGETTRFCAPTWLLCARIRELCDRIWALAAGVGVAMYVLVVGIRTEDR